MKSHHTMPRFKTIFDLFKQTVSDWLDDRAPRLGAALAYYTIFSIAPLVVIVIAVAGLCFGREAAEHQIYAQLGGLVGEQGSKAISGLLEAANKPHEGFVASALAGVTLLFGATGVFVQLQDALNAIWEVKPKPGRGLRAFFRHRLLSLAMVFGIGFLLLVSLVVSAALAAAGNWLQGSLPGDEAFWQIINFVFSFIIIAVLFTMIFKYLPDVKIAWRDVWLGGALTAFLFTVGKYALGMYLGRSSVSSAYGAAGSLVVLLLWVYYSAQILFFGAEFTQAYATRFGRKPEPASNAIWAPGHKPASGGV
jgi:membrane protein